MTVREMISHLAHAKCEEENCDCDAIDDADDLYEDASESEPSSPTPGEKYAGPSTRDGRKTLREVDRYWTALESETAHDDIVNRLNQIVDRQYNLGYKVRDMVESSKEVSEVTKRLTTTAATQLNALTSKVNLLVKTRNQDPLERKVEELSGQLVSLAQRARQQQELLDKVLEKVSAPPTVQVQVPATPGPPTPQPRPRP